MHKQITVKYLARLDCSNRTQKKFRVFFKFKLNVVLIKIKAISFETCLLRNMLASSQSFSFFLIFPNINFSMNLWSFILCFTCCVNGLLHQALAFFVKAFNKSKGIIITQSSGYEAYQGLASIFICYKFSAVWNKEHLEFHESLLFLV